MRIARDALDAVIDHANRCRPEECCGILLTAGDGTVDCVLPALNEEGERPESSYRLGRAAHIEAVRRECTGAARIVGYYHSHPAGPSRPSQTDAARAVRDVTYVVVGLAEDPPVPSGWRWTGEEFAGEPLEIMTHDNADPYQDARREC